MEKSVEGGSAEEACSAATIGESLNQDRSEIEAWRSDVQGCKARSCSTNAQVGQGLLAQPQQTGAPPRIFTTQPSGSNRFWLRMQEANGSGDRKCVVC
jgi:hypothetical protein